MKKSIFVSLAGCFLLTLNGAQAVSAQDSAGLGEVFDDGASLEDPSVEEDLDPIAEQLDSLSLVQKVSQLMFVTFEGTQAPSSIERELLYGFTPGGVILPKLNSPAAAANYLREMQRNQLNVDRDVPLFIATDYYSLSSQPYGQHRFPPVPPPLALGAGIASGSTDDAAKLVAEYLDVMGIRIHIGPLLTTTSTLPGTRTSLALFGETPQSLVQVAEDFGHRFSEHDIAWIPVGFPGGSSNKTGREPPVLSTPRLLLGERELAPYIAAIESGTRFMHVANVLVPTITDTRMPASMSSEAIQGLLRRELGFNGIVVAGPLNDPALAILDDPARGPEYAVLAGADMLWWMGTGPQAAQSVVRLVRAVESGQIPESVIDDRVSRILRIKQEMELESHPLPSESDIKKFVKDRSKDVTRTIRQLDASGIVLVKGTRELLPLTESSAPMGITGVAGVEHLYDALEKEIEPLARYQIGTAQHGKQLFDFEIGRIMRTAKGTKIAVCIFSADVYGPTQRELLRQLRQAGSKTVTVLLGVPKELRLYADHTDALFVILRPPDDRLGATMAALADTLLGRGPMLLREPERPLTVSAGKLLTYDISELAATPVGALPVSSGDEFPVGFRLGYPANMDKRKVVWDFGDGSKKSDPVIDHAYNAPGRYELNVTVIESGDELATQTYEVEVQALQGAPTP